MNEELNLDGKTYVSSKRAAQTSQYAQDYIGQLCRQNLIDSRRVNGLWYVTLESIENHKISSAEQKAQAFANTNAATEAPQSVQNDVILDFSGEEYVSSKRGAEMTGYNQDYVTQLARAGKVKSRQVGSRWYVAKKDLLSNKEKNDALLAAVQAKSVGIVRIHGNTIDSNEKWEPNFKAHEAEDHLPLMPHLPPRGFNAASSTASGSANIPVHRTLEQEYRLDPVYTTASNEDMGRILDLKAYQRAGSQKKSAQAMTLAPKKAIVASILGILLVTGGFFLVRGIFSGKDESQPDGVTSQASSGRTSGGLIESISYLVASTLHYKRSP